jgi:hypothetical protein
MANPTPPSLLTLAQIEVHPVSLDTHLSEERPER